MSEARGCCIRPKATGGHLRRQLPAKGQRCRKVGFRGAKATPGHRHQRGLLTTRALALSPGWVGGALGAFFVFFECAEPVFLNAQWTMTRQRSREAHLFAASG